MIALVGSLLALAVGPLIYSRAQREPQLGRALDGFVLVAIAGLVLLEILPDVVEHAGWWVLLVVALGIWGPSWLERLFRRAAHKTHMATVLLSALGLMIHTIFDGAALSPGGAHSLGLAIVIHRVPVSLAVWWLLRPVLGPIIPSLMLCAMAGGTLLGYGLGEGLHIQAAETGFAALQAFVAGSILHVVFNRPHLDPALADSQRGPSRAEGLGSLVGLVVFLAMLTSEILGGHTSLAAIQRFVDLSLAAAPALILAYAAGGLIVAFMPASSMRWLGRGGSLSQAARGVVVGLPLPICSCGVVPLYQSFVRRGAPPSAAMALLIATPELGLDAILISIPLLGVDMTLARVAAAAFVALAVGWLLGRYARVLAAEYGDCTAEETTITGPPGERLRAGLRYGFGDLVDSTAPWIVLGLIIAATAQPLLAQPWLQAIPPSLQVIAFALLGLPLYVCATGSTPIVAVMLISGVAPGAALAFLLTGPATNPATFGMLSRLHGPKLALAFGVATGGLAILCGLLLNYVALDLTLSPGDLDALPAMLNRVALVIFGLLVLSSLARRGARSFLAELQVGRVQAH